jgi:hypothetical protein
MSILIVVNVMLPPMRMALSAVVIAAALVIGWMIPASVIDLDVFGAV